MWKRHPAPEDHAAKAVTAVPVAMVANIAVTTIAEEAATVANADANLQ